MIHILLVILKMMGIVLLVVLGLLFSILLAVLFIPVRYKVEGNYHGQLLLSVCATWFFHILVFGAVYESEGMVCSLRVLGFRLWHNQEEDPARDLEDGLKTILGDEEQSLYKELQQDEEHYRKTQEEHRKTDTDGRAGGGRSQEKQSNDSQSGGGQAHDTQFHGRHTGGQDTNRRESRTEEDKTGPEPDKQGSGVTEKIKGIATRINRSVRHILEKLRFSFEKIFDKLKGIREPVLGKKVWLGDEKDQASLRLLYKQTKHLFKHLWSRKGRRTITFGFDDPYTTGRVLQAVSPIHPFYHRQLFLYPVFNERILDVEGGLRGKIRLSVILWLVLRILFGKHTHRMLKGFLKWYDTCDGCRGMVNSVPLAARGNE